MQVDELLPYLREHWEELVQQLRERKYKPNPVRRVEIPKQENECKGKLDEGVIFCGLRVGELI